MNLPAEMHLSAVGQLADVATERSALLGFFQASLPLPEHFSRVLDIGHDIVAFLANEIPYLGHKLTHEKSGKGRFLFYYRGGGHG